MSNKENFYSAIKNICKNVLVLAVLFFAAINIFYGQSVVRAAYDPGCYDTATVNGSPGYVKIDCPDGIDINANESICYWKYSPAVNDASNYTKVDCDTWQEVTTNITDQDGQNLINWVNNAINLLAGIAILAITGSIIFAGIQYSTAGGSPQAATAAKKRITDAVYALAAFIFMYGFLQWIVPGGIF